MKTNKIYMVVSFLAMLAVLLPVKSTFARAEVNESSGDNIKSSEIETEALRREDDGEKVETNTTKQDDDAEKIETGTIKQQNDEDENVAETHRNTVASFVKNLLEMADKNKGGIGEEVSAVAKEQDDSEATTTEAIQQIENRGALKTFLIGTDYKNIGVLRSQIAKTQARIDQLTRLLDQMASSTVSASTTEQLQLLKQTEDKLANFVTTNENKFSLFGWFVKLFSK